MKTREITLILFFIISSLVVSKAQPVFSTVPIQSGKVVFQQYVYVEKEMSESQKYTVLNQWGKKKYAGNTSLIGIRFDDKAGSMTVSAKTELTLSGTSEKVVMTYRYDVSVTNVGCMLIIRDVAYQFTQGDKKNLSAENTITDSAIASASGGEKTLNQNIRNATLFFFNQLYDEIKAIY